MSIPEPIQVPTVWIGLEQRPIEMASHLVAQVNAPNEIIINLGQAAPPLVFGTPEEQAAQFRASLVQVRPIARISLTAHRVRELITLLQQSIEAHDRVFGGGTVQ